MFLRQITAAEAVVVTVSDLREFGRIDHDHEDAQLEMMLAAATQLVSEYAGRALVLETWEVSIPARFQGDLVLPKSPVRALTAIRYFDANESEQTANLDDFYLMRGDDRALVRPKSGKAWPTSSLFRDDAISVRFTVGYESAPAPLVHAVKMTALHLYEQREAVSELRLGEVPLGVRAMIDAYRVGWAYS